MPRAEFTRKTMTKAFNRANGHCERCTAKLGPGNREYDHIVPCELGGDNDLSNCMVLCRSCHGAKTKNDVRSIRKSDRQRDKHNKAMHPKRRLTSRNTFQPQPSNARQMYGDVNDGQ